MPKVIDTQDQLFTRRQFEVFQILGRSGRIDVLTLLLRNPKEEFTIRDIARATDVPAMTVSRSVKDFERLSMVRKRRIGNAYAVSVSENSLEVELVRNMAEYCRFE
jgi:DNA-binding MarR family transcriptional regulator